MKILIVDDHAVVRHGLKSAIESHGYEVIAETGSIHEAQAFMAQTNPDVIVVDINLPDGSGSGGMGSKSFANNCNCCADIK
jgi:DNA-binding NarL/FixJ family response regulator